MPGHAGLGLLRLDIPQFLDADGKGYVTYSRVSMGRIEELQIFDRVFGEVYTS